MRTRFGVNYIPSTHWLYSWVDWDRAEISADLAAIAGLGFDHVRLHLLWPLVQPNPSWISPTILRRLIELLDLCGEHGLQGQVTVLNGWMSGFLFRPSWVMQDRSFYSDATVITAQKLLLSTVATAIAGHPAALGIDIGNELSVLADYEPFPHDRAQTDDWSEDLLATCADAMPDGMHCNGVDHRPWLTDAAPFTRHHLATRGAVTVVHAWPYFTGAFDRYGTEDQRALHIGAFLTELASAHATDPSRRVWAQEIGLSGQWIPPDRIEAAAAAFLRTTASAGNLWGVTWWCSHDVDPGLRGFDALEYDLGLLSTDNTVKPMGAAVAAAIRAARADDEPPARSTALVVPPGTPTLALMDAYLALHDAGDPPALVLAERREDAGHLAARGITRVVDGDD